MIEGMLAEIRLFAGNFAPRNWEFCEGQILAIERYTALYSLLGIQYGGDGRETFKLPKLDNIKCEQGELRYIICMVGVYPERQ